MNLKTKNLQVMVLSDDEKILDTLNPKFVQIPEENELQGLRTITITHPIIDDTNDEINNVGRYETILKPGHKIFLEFSTDGDNVLYVLHGPKEVNTITNEIIIGGTEVARELSETIPIEINYTHEFELTANNLNTHYGKYFTIGNISKPSEKFYYQGIINHMALLREIEATTGYEFQFRYELDKNNNKIIRYLDLVNQIGKTHKEPIELGYNSPEVSWTIDDTEVRTAVCPIGNNLDDKKKSADEITFMQIMTQWKAWSVQKGQTIGFGYYKDENDNWQPTDTAKAPFTKKAGQLHIECDELTEIAALYTRIRNKEGSTTTNPRCTYFETSEEKMENIYWEGVNTLKEDDKCKSEITIEAKVVDINKLTDGEAKYYNKGDKVLIKIKDLRMTLEGRVKKTAKDSRDPDGENITIGTSTTNIIDSIIKNVR